MLTLQKEPSVPFLVRLTMAVIKISIYWENLKSPGAAHKRLSIYLYYKILISPDKVQSIWNFDKACG